MIRFILLAALFGPMIFVPAPVTAAAPIPIANPDEYSAQVSTVLVVPDPGVLDNDVLPIAVSLNIASGPAHGSLVLNAGGGFTYTPTLDWSGTDTFTYRLVWEGGSVTAPVTILVISDPVAQDDSYVAYLNRTLEIARPGVLENDFPVDPDLTAHLVTPPTHGTVRLSGDGSFTYIPERDYVGLDAWTYAVALGSSSFSEPATVSLEVANPPTAAFVVDTLTVPEYGSVEITIQVRSRHNGGTINVWFAPLTADCFGEAPDLDCSAQTLTLLPDQREATFSVPIVADDVPERQYESLTIGFSITGDEPDIALVDPRYLSLFILDEDNHVPVAEPDAYTVGTGQVLAVEAPGLLANDTDADLLDTLSAELAVGPEHGALSLSPDGTVIYRPETGWAGVDTFTYTATDGMAFSEPAAVSITVLPRYLYLPVIQNGLTGPACPTAESEPNNTTSDADLICPGTPMHGAHDGNTGTGDIYRLSLDAGEALAIGLETADATGVQLVLYLETGTGPEPVAQDTTAPFTITYTAPKTATYYVYVYSGAGFDNTGSYTLQVE